MVVDAVAEVAAETLRDTDASPSQPLSACMLAADTASQGQEQEKEREQGDDCECESQTMEAHVYVLFQSVMDSAPTPTPAQGHQLG